MAESDGEEDFHFWGTPVEDEVEMRAGQHRKVGWGKQPAPRGKAVDQRKASCASWRARQGPKCAGWPAEPECGDACFSCAQPPCISWKNDGKCLSRWTACLCCRAGGARCSFHSSTAAAQAGALPLLLCSGCRLSHACHGLAGCGAFVFWDCLGAALFSLLAGHLLLWLPACVSFGRRHPAAATNLLPWRPAVHRR